MVHRARDARSDVQLRGDGHSGLADLRVVTDPTLVGRDACGTDRSAEHVRQLLERCEVTVRAATAHHDDLGLTEGRTGRGSALDVLGHRHARCALVHGDGVRDDGGCRRVGDRLGLHRVGLECDDREPGPHRAARVPRPREDGLGGNDATVDDLDRRRVHDDARARDDADPRADLLVLERRRQQQHRRAGAHREICERPGRHRGQPCVRVADVQPVHRLDPVRAEQLERARIWVGGRRVGACDPCALHRAERSGGRQELEHRRSQRAVGCVVEQDQHGAGTGGRHRRSSFGHGLRAQTSLFSTR
jgi:hypothetical protein